MPDLTPLEAAEIIENGDCGQHRYDADSIAAFYLRKIVSGEYAPVVRCEKCRNFVRKNVVLYGLDGFCEKMHKLVAKDFHCAFGALMGGKDDSHETS